MDIVKEANRVAPQYESILKQKVSLFIPKAKSAFPGAQPVSFLREHMDRLKNENFFVSEKSDGTRYLMFIHCVPVVAPQFPTQQQQQPSNSVIQECFLIDRKNSYYFIPYVFPANPQATQLIDNTLVDGELVLDRGDDGVTVKPRFLIFDLLVLEGQSYIDRPFSKRLGYLKTRILDPLHAYQRQIGQSASSNHFQQQPQPPPIMSVELKKMELSYGMKVVWDSIPTLKHGNDGLIFTAESAPYELGTCEAMIKWKPPDMNSIDFKLRVEGESPPQFKLDIAVAKNQYRQFADMKQVPDEWLLRPWEYNGRIVECKYSSDIDSWTFMRFREDKNQPNHESVVPRIMKSIEEGVPVAQLLDPQYLSEIRSAWKARQQQQRKN